MMRSREQQPKGEAVGSVLTPSHGEWLGKGGAAPEAPASGMKANAKIIDYAQPSREKLRDEIAAAILEDGFFIMVNHPVQAARVKSMLQVAKDFFSRLVYTETGKRKRVQEKIRMNTMLRPMTKAARGFSDFEEESLNAFMGPDQKFTFDYALQNDAAFIGRREAFNKEEAALYEASQSATATDPGVVAALKAKYRRVRTCEEHLGKNLWPEEETAEETARWNEEAPQQGLTAPALSFPRGVKPSQGARDAVTEGELEKEMRSLVTKLKAEKEGKAPHKFRTACEAYLELMYPLSMDLLSLILEGAGGLAPEVIAKEVLPLFDDPLVINRLISYPPQRPLNRLRFEAGGPELIKAINERVMRWRAEQEEEARAADSSSRTKPPDDVPGDVYERIRTEEIEKLVNKKVSMSCGAHVDYGAITMIAEDRGQALEVERRSGPKTYEYLPDIPPGALIVSTGFMLEKLTNGKIPATRHRVQNLLRQEGPVANESLSDPPIVRTAMAFFLDPHPEAFIAPLPQCINEKKGEKALYEGCVAGAKGVRFGDPRYLGRIAESVGVLPKGGGSVAPAQGEVR